MKILFFLIFFPLTSLAEKLPPTSSLRSGKILFECSKITDKKIIRAVYLAQQEYFQKAKIREKDSARQFEAAYQRLGHYFEPKKFPLEKMHYYNPLPSDFKFLASGTYLYLHPNRNSPIVGVVTTRLMNGNTDECEDYLGNAWGRNNQYQYMGVIATLSGKYLGSVFDDYMAFVGDFWRLPQGMPEEFSAESCKNIIKHHRCEEPEFDMPDLTVRGILYRSNEVWYQMPFMVDGVYPWIKNKFLKKNRSDSKIEDGKVFGDLAGKKVKFLVYPDYFESTDGKIVYLVNPEIKEDFKGQIVKNLVEGVTPWWNFRVSKTDDEYIYFNVMYEAVFDIKNVAEITQKLPPLELRVAWNLITRPNGTLRLDEISEFDPGHLNKIKRHNPYFFRPGDTHLIPKDISALDVFKEEISKMKDNHKKESIERFLKDVVWN